MGRNVGTARQQRSRGSGRTSRCATSWRSRSVVSWRACRRQPPSASGRCGGRGEALPSEEVERSPLLRWPARAPLLHLRPVQLVHRPLRWTVKEWQAEERRLARRRGGTQTPGSGSGWRKPNDVREHGILWEQKSTGNRQYTIKEDDWEKLRANALLAGQIPALHITLGAKKRRLVLIEEADFEEGHPPDRSE